MIKQNETVPDKYVADTILTVGYVTTNDKPDLFIDKGYREVPMITTRKTGVILPCNGWDLCNARISSGMDFIYSTYPQIRFQAMRDWSSGVDTTDNLTFTTRYRDVNARVCPDCMGKLTIVPSNLIKVCINCVIQESPYDVDRRLSLFKASGRISDVQNVVLKYLFDDTNPISSLRHSVTPEPGILTHWLQSNGYRSEMDMEVFSVFTDYDAEALTSALLEDFMNSMVRDRLTINFFEGQDLIRAFVEDLYSEEVKQALVPGYEAVSVGVEEETDPTAHLGDDDDGDPVVMELDGDESP